MLYSGPYSQSVEIWRKPRDTWGNGAAAGTKKPPAPALAGYTFSHEIEEATVTPRTTEVVRSSPEDAKQNYTGMILFCSVYEDIQSDDLVVWTDPAGRIQVAEVEGESANDYVSPYSGFEAGKEIFLGRVRHRR